MKWGSDMFQSVFDCSNGQINATLKYYKMEKFKLHRKSAEITHEEKEGVMVPF